MPAFFFLFQERNLRFYDDKEIAIALHNSTYASLAYTRVGPNGPMWIAPEMNVFDPRYKGKRYWTEKNQVYPLLPRYKLSGSCSTAAVCAMEISPK